MLGAVFGPAFSAFNVNYPDRSVLCAVQRYSRTDHSSVLHVLILTPDIPPRAHCSLYIAIFVSATQNEGPDFMTGPCRGIKLKRAARASFAQVEIIGVCGDSA